CGNAAPDQVQIITVKDNTPPAITVPTTITVIYDPAECGKTVTYSVTANDNCSGAVTPTLKSGSLASGSVFPLGTTTVTWEAVDACGNTSEKSFDVVVNPAPTTSVLTVTPGSLQYSDQVTLKVVIEGGASRCGGPQAAASATFTINGQVMKDPGTNITNIPFVAVGNNLEATLTTPLLDYTANYANGVMKPGNKTVSAVINGIADEFAVSQPASQSLTATQEDARIDYTGDVMRATATATTYSATVTLRANIFDLSATSEAASDIFPGDIRNAKVKFVNRDANTDISGWIPVSSLVNSADSRIGTVSFDYLVSGLSSSTPYKFITVGIVVDNGYYIRNRAEDDVVITVYTPVGDFITGGGYIVPTRSVGSMASDPGKKVNFGFNVKFNKKGNNLQGNMNIIFRRTEADNTVHVYQIKANAMLSLGVNASNPSSQTAEYVSKTNITDITNPLAPVSLGGNKYLYVKMTDNGEPGLNDLISFALVDGTADPTVMSNLIFSSNWENSKTEKLPLAGGNLVVHSGFNLGATSNSTAKKSAVIEIIEPVASEPGLKVWPNPFSERLYFEFSHATATQARLELFDATGAKLATLFDQRIEGGQVYRAEYLPQAITSRMVFYRLTMGGQSQVGKLIYQQVK
ncbi:MAG TPA: HYR domain-containing protein, partial [Prolixibacteraceae bacterium]|nr:HYR domain-containing protein [Prolixibacteraceae bacterium]